MDVSREILDNLMGRNRNKTANEIKMRDSYTNKDICKSFLICFCFHTLFPNTAYEDGPCKYKHDPYLKTMFDMDTTRGEYEKIYLAECINWIEKKLADVEIRIKKNKELIQIKSNNPGERPKEVIDKLLEVDEEIEETVRQAEIFAENGQIFDSERCMNDVERLREKKKQIEMMGDNITSSSLKMQKICEICGAIQVINDTEKRLQTHLEGKIHQGFLRLRHEIETLRARLDILNNTDPNEVREGESAKPQVEVKRGEAQASKMDLEKEQHKSHDTEKHRNVETKAKESDKDKDKYKQREKERDRGERERGRDYDRDKDREREKEREREKDKQRQKQKQKEKERQRQRQREKEKQKQKQRQREKDRQREREKDKEREKDRFRSKDGERERSRDRSKDRKEKKKDKDRSRDRRDRSRSHHKRKHKRDSYD